MPISSSTTKTKKAARKNKDSRAAIEQSALEGRGHDLYRYFMKYEMGGLDDLTLLHLSYLWLYCDPKKELTVDQFLDMTEDQIHERF